MRRRNFLQGSALAAAGVWGGLLEVDPALAFGSQRRPDVVIQLVASRRRAQILPGPATDVWSYRGRVESGSADVLQDVPGSYLGPTIRVRRGQRVRIEFRNRLNERSLIHWHGLHVPADMDGHPRFAVGPGGRYGYEFDVVNRAGTYWYHPHPHGRTGPQVYQGLAGLFIVTDEEEEALGLPSGARDVALVIQDRHFDDDNRLLYMGFGAGPGMNGMPGFLGNQILVNGQPHPTLAVEPAPYRLRLLNGSNSRIYKLGWSNGQRLTVIGSDGGLLRRAVQREFVTLAPAERVDLWVDFADWPGGAEAELRTLEFDAGMAGFGPGGGFEMPMGSQADVLTVRVAPTAAQPGALPVALTEFPSYSLQDAVNAGSPRPFEFGGQFGLWTINGRAFEMDAVAADEKVGLGTLEAWDLENGTSGSGMGMMSMRMPHPVHVHGQSFQVIDRDVRNGFGSHWGTVADGYVDEGWKDTVLLMPGERVRLLKRFDDHAGTFLIHCHNLEHEDAGMMRNYLVEA